MAKRKKTPKRLTKRERKALEGRGPSGHEGEHIHCVSCGRHIDPPEFVDRPSKARWLRCDHGTRFAACAPCVPDAQRRLEEHEQSGKPVAVAGAYH
jgi:hypothetical protein